MGTINVEGLGIVEIQGDTPTDEEQQAILSAISKDDGDPDVSFIPPKPEVEPQEGPLGIVDPNKRQAMRDTVEDQPGLIPLLMEISPAAGGAVAGATIGAAGGPPGMIAGGIIGGLGGELFAQETGIAPASELNLGLAGAGPVLGPAAGTAFKGVRRAAGFVTSKLPFVRTARAKNVLPKAVEEFESLGTRIIDKQTGLMSRPASELYGAVRRSGVIIDPQSLSGTKTAIQGLVDELTPFKDFPEADQAIKALARLDKTLFSQAKDASGAIIPSDISIDTLVRTRQLLGNIISKAESGGGVKLGSAKEAFKAISNDLDAIANSPSLKGRAARLAQTAIKRAKLEFAVKDIDASVARFVTTTGDDTVINAKGMNKWFQDVTNPKHKNFDKNLADALGDEIPHIKSRLAKLTKILGSGSPGGPGSLVIRGRLTSGAVGILAGIGAGGPIGGAVGAMIGTNTPEMLTALMMSKTGSAMLEKAVNAGHGQINMRTWITIGEMVTRSAGDKKEIKAELKSL